MKHIHALHRFCASALLALACTSEAQVVPAAQWQGAADLQAAGWSSEKLDAAAAYTRASLKTDAWMLVHRGVVVREFGDVTKVTNIASMRKSVFSVLIGMQVDQGRFNLDWTLAELGIDDKDGLTGIEKGATTRHLLQGRSGIYHGSAYEAAAMKVGRPARGAFKPGENFNYNNWDFNALGTIFRQTTGRTVFEALRDDLSSPLQFQDYEFATAGRFQTEAASIHPAYVMRLSTRDMARIGLLMSRGGKWSDKQLVSRRWVEESTTSHSQFRTGNGYGYMWWVGFSEGYAARLRFPGHVYLAVGNLGQYMVVDPVRDIVFVHKVNFEYDPTREVTNAQFAELLARVLEARVGNP